MKKTKSYETISKYMSERKGMGPLSTLTMIFVVLKLTNNIDWSWLYVLSPMWVPMASLLVVFIVVFIVVLPVLFVYMLCAELIKQIKKALN